MTVFLRAAIALLAASLALQADAADAAATAASAPASAPAPVDPCLAPGPDRAANHACAVGLARRAESERNAGHNDAALAALARADAFSPQDLRFAMGHAGLALKAANQLTPAGIEAAAKAAPDDAGLAMTHAELSIAKRDFAGAINRFKIVVTQYQTTRHVEEALERLTESYMALGITGEAQTAAAVLGHNFPDSRWYADAYKLVKSNGLEPLENKGSWISRAFADLPVPFIGIRDKKT